MSERQLPEIQDSLLSDAMMDQLVVDLTVHAEVLDVLTKGGAKLRAGEGVVSLDKAVQALRSLQTHAIQIRYRFQGAEWRDTIMATPSGWRIVRINLTEALS